MRHVLICTTLYRDHWAKTVGKKMAEAAKQTDEEKARLTKLKPEEHADGHIGLHCGETIGGGLYEAFQVKLKERGIDDVLVSPNACIAQHVAGCMVMVYPEGIWYAVHAVDELDRIIDEHIVKGEPVDDLIHRRLKDPQGRGINCPLPGASGLD
jgi:(2Fe-2S) ferredoxin